MSRETIHVLVVDDDEDACVVMKALLESCGAVVTTVSDAEAALRVLETFAVDVIVSDIAMPRRDGYWLIREIRNRPPLVNIPGIALTALVEPEDRRRILAAGYQAHLAKPFGIEHVWTTIQHVVTRARECTGQ